MDKAENLWRLKRTRQRYESIRESPPKNPKRGSDGQVLFTGGDIQEMMQATLSEITSTVATVKEQLPREYAHQPLEWLTTESPSESRDVRPHSPRSTRKNPNPSTVSSPNKEDNNASTRVQPSAVREELTVASGSELKPVVVSQIRLATKNGNDVSEKHYPRKNGANASGTRSHKTSANGQMTMQEDCTRPHSDEQVAPSRKSSGEQTRLKERLHHLRSRWRAAQRILDEIGARLSGGPTVPSEQIDNPAVQAYRGLCGFYSRWALRIFAQSCLDDRFTDRASAYRHGKPAGQVPARKCEQFFQQFCQCNK
ncbi:hypothetical protein MRX96_045980 [Rhipicephalus microplus]